MRLCHLNGRHHPPFLLHLPLKKEGRATISYYGIENDNRSQKRSPLLPEDRIIGIPKKLNELDIISELLARNCGRICQSICGYLEGNDLCRFVFLFSSVKIFSKDFGVAEFVSNLNIFIDLDPLCFYTKQMTDHSRNIHLFRFASVSKTWRMFVMRESHIQEKLS